MANGVARGSWKREKRRGGNMELVLRSAISTGTRGRSDYRPLSYPAFLDSLGFLV